MPHGGKKSPWAERSPPLYDPFPSIRCLRLASPAGGFVAKAAALEIAVAHHDLRATPLLDGYRQCHAR